MHKRKAAVSRIIWTILCRGEQRNFAKWPTKFGKIYRGKLWAY